MDPDSIEGASRGNENIVSLAYSLKDEMISKLEEELNVAAGDAGYNLIIFDSDNSAAIQLEQVRSARRRGFKGIIINLVNPKAAPAILEAAGNMKVIFIAHIPADISILNPNAIYIGVDQREAGRLQGEWLANYFKEKGKTKIKYILLKGTVNLLPNGQRTEPALQALADNGIKATAAVQPIIANYERAKATSRLITILRSGVKFDAIIADNDEMALGAIQAFEDMGMDPARAVIVGIGATEPAVQAVVQGKLDMTVYQNRKKRAEATIKAMDNMLNGRPFDEEIEHLVLGENRYVILYPYEPVIRYNLPEDLYF
jgi:ABC-type sugar transport system substrate-binding protein